MSALRVVLLFLAAAAAASSAYGHPRSVSGTPGPVVSLSAEIDGEPAPLYPAPDGGERLYLEARAGRPYSLTLTNHSAERVGAVLVVDGLNVINGQRDQGRGRMYVLDPWQSTTVRGWRSSLHEVHEFTFVDERASYAARSGKANRKMGWIELAVYRERRAVALQPTRPPGPGWIEPLERQEQEKSAAPSVRGGSAGSYPGTGWGRSAQDTAVLVDFDPAEQPCQTVALRYEYRSALVALGVLPRHGHADRLHQRENAEAGFAPPPRW
jgi:hypothetical protein